MTGWRLPEVYSRRMAMLVLMICERFAMDPFGGWFESLGEPEQAMLLAYERIRGAEDLRRGGGL